MTTIQVIEAASDLIVLRGNVGWQETFEFERNALFSGKGRAFIATRVVKELNAS